MKSSKLPERLVVDATAIISAIAGGRANRIFRERPDSEYATTAFTVEEVGHWIDDAAMNRKLSRHDLELAITALPLRIYKPDQYADYIGEATKRIRDQKDVDLLALALKLESPVWSNDRDFRGTGVKCYKTGQLLRSLEFTVDDDSASDASEQPQAPPSSST